MRVREALTGKDPSLFREFLYILNEFTENQTSTPLELYGQLCEVMSADFCSIFNRWYIDRYYKCYSSIISVLKILNSVVVYDCLK